MPSKTPSKTSHPQGCWDVDQTFNCKSVCCIGICSFQCTCMTFAYIWQKLCCYNKKLEERESEKIAETENPNVPEVSTENVQVVTDFSRYDETDHYEADSVDAQFVAINEYNFDSQESFHEETPETPNQEASETKLNFDQSPKNPPLSKEPSKNST